MRKSHALIHIYDQTPASLETVIKSFQLNTLFDTIVLPNFPEQGLTMKLCPSLHTVQYHHDKENNVVKARWYRYEINGIKVGTIEIDDTEGPKAALLQAEEKRAIYLARYHAKHTLQLAKNLRNDNMAALKLRVQAGDTIQPALACKYMACLPAQAFIAEFPSNIVAFEKEYAKAIVICLEQLCHRKNVATISARRMGLVAIWLAAEGVPFTTFQRYLKEKGQMADLSTKFMNSFCAVAFPKLWQQYAAISGWHDSRELRSWILQYLRHMKVHPLTYLQPKIETTPAEETKA